MDPGEENATSSRVRCRYGKQLVSSGKGESSHQEHPFVALVTPGTDQERVRFTMHFVYSGNFIGQVERCQFDTVRMVMGINSNEFCWNLTAGDEFQVAGGCYTLFRRGTW